MLDARKVVNFIKNHENAFCETDAEKTLFYEMPSYVENGYDLEDFFREYECDNNCDCGLGLVIANIMARETGIRFEYHEGQEDCEGKESVLLTEKHPWWCNDMEKALTEEEIKKICSKYMTELDIEGARII